MTYKTLITLSIFSVIILSGCGSSSNPAENRDEILTTVTKLSGTAIDGYIEGATVCADINQNNRCDPDEPTAYTDALGQFTLNGLESTDAPLLLFGGIDTGTGLAFEGVLSAPAGATTVTPLTSMVHAMSMAGNLTPEEAETQLKILLALHDDINLSHYDPIDALTNGLNVNIAREVLAAQTQVQILLQLINSVFQEVSPSSDMMYHIINALARQLIAGNSIADPEVIKAIIIESAEQSLSQESEAYQKVIQTVSVVSNQITQYANSAASSVAAAEISQILEVMNGALFNMQENLKKQIKEMLQNENSSSSQSSQSSFFFEDSTINMVTPPPRPVYSSASTAQSSSPQLPGGGGEISGGSGGGGVANSSSPSSSSSIQSSSSPSSNSSSSESSSFSSESSSESSSSSSSSIYRYFIGVNHNIDGHDECLYRYHWNSSRQFQFDYIKNGFIQTDAYTGSAKEYVLIMDLQNKYAASYLDPDVFEFLAVFSSLENAKNYMIENNIDDCSYVFPTQDPVNTTLKSYKIYDKYREKDFEDFSVNIKVDAPDDAGLNLKVEDYNSSLISVTPGWINTIKKGIYDFIISSIPTVVGEGWVTLKLQNANTTEIQNQNVTVRSIFKINITKNPNGYGILPGQTPIP